MSTEVINDFSDVIMGYFEYTNAPVATQPDANRSYNYPVNEVNVSPSTVRSLEGRVDRLSETSEKKWFTYLTKIKFASFMGVATSIAAAVAVFTVSTNPAVIIISAVALAAIGIYSAYQHISCWMSYDLESASSRDALRTALRGKNFSEISDKYSFDEVVGYDLLKEQARNCSLDDDKEYYALTNALYQEKQVAVVHRDEDLKQAQNIFTRGTENFRRWHNLALSRMSHSDTMRYLRQRGSSQGTQSDEYKSISNFVNSYLKLVIDRKFDDLMSPWRHWQSRENAHISSAFSNAQASLDRQFVRA